jgi:hypothetical protein
VGLVVLLALWALTPLLHYLPMACLGGIIEVALLSLVDTEPFYRAYRVAFPDFVVMVASFVFTAVVNIEARSARLGEEESQGHAPSMKLQCVCRVAHGLACLCLSAERSGDGHHPLHRRLTAGRAQLHYSHS